MAPCARCGTFLCSACTEVMGESAYCADCIAWLHQHAPASRWVQGTIALSILGIVSVPLCLLFLVPVVNLVAAGLGLGVSTRELRRIRSGEAPLRGMLQAKVARALAVVNLVLALLGAVAVVYLRVSSGR